MRGPRRKRKMADDGEGSGEVVKSKTIHESASSDNDGSKPFGSDNKEFESADEDGIDEDGIDKVGIHEDVSDSVGESLKLEISSFQTKFSLEKLVELIGRLTKDQKKLVHDCGFGSILGLQCKHMPYKQLIAMLASFYDEKTQSIQIPGTLPFNIDGRKVHWILGIPHGGEKINRTAKQMTKNLIAEDTNTPGRNAPKIDDLIKLIDTNLVGDRFVRIFMLVVLSIFLCPSSADRASCHYYNGISVVKSIKSFDWCDAVATCLKSGLCKFKNSSKTSRNPSFPGCIFVLYTAYFDHLGLDVGIVPAVPQTIPRIHAWIDDLVDKYMLKFATFTKIEIKPVESTVFGKASLKRKRTRGSCGDAMNEAPACVPNIAGPSSKQDPSDKLKKITKDHSSTLLPQNVQATMDSALSVFPGCTESDLRVFSGQELHPEIEKHINSLAGPQCTNEN